MTTEEKKKDLTNRLLKISGQKYLNGTIPLAKCFIVAENNNRIKLLKELIDSGCIHKNVLHKLETEIHNEIELERIDKEISEMIISDVNFSG